MFERVKTLDFVNLLDWEKDFDWLNLFDWENLSDSENLFDSVNDFEKEKAEEGVNVSDWVNLTDGLKISVGPGVCMLVSINVLYFTASSGNSIFSPQTESRQFSKAIIYVGKIKYNFKNNLNYLYI